MVNSSIDRITKQMRRGKVCGETGARGVKVRGKERGRNRQTAVVPTNVGCVFHYVFFTFPWHVADTKGATERKTEMMHNEFDS